MVVGLWEADLIQKCSLSAIVSCGDPGPGELPYLTLD